MSLMPNYSPDIICILFTILALTYDMDGDKKTLTKLTAKLVLFTYFPLLRDQKESKVEGMLGQADDVQQVKEMKL